MHHHQSHFIVPVLLGEEAVPDELQVHLLAGVPDPFLVVWERSREQLDLKLQHGFDYSAVEEIIIHEQLPVRIVELDERVDILENFALESIVGVLEEPKYKSEGILRLDLNWIVHDDCIWDWESGACMQGPVHYCHIEWLEVHVSVCFFHRIVLWWVCLNHFKLQLKFCRS